MAEESNPTGRVIDVLSLLAAHPEQDFTLAEIARQLGMSNGSAHRVLTGLAKAGFLARDEKRRSYSLGVAMVAIGQAALEKYRGVEVARREIGRLAAALEVQASANTVAGGEVMVLVKEGAPNAQAWLTRVGERRPLVPPMGLCHVAWGGAAAEAAYVARVEAALAPEVKAQLQAALPAIRRRGFSVTAMGPNSGAARQVMALPAGSQPDAEYWERVLELVGRLTPAEVQVLDLREAGAAGIASIAAPVFSGAGTVAMQVVISGLQRGMETARIEEYAENLCAAAARITSALNGRLPKG